MDKQICKFEIPTSNFLVRLPRGAHVLSAGAQGQSVMIWAEIDPGAEMVVRRFPVYGTGHKIDNTDASLHFIGTVFMGPFVWHVFDAGEETDDVQG